MTQIIEMMDIVDKNDIPIGEQISQNDLYKSENPPLHRIVHVMIFNNLGEFALQLRSKEKSYCPSHWSTPVGGHPISPESYEDAAIREGEEELGKTLQLTNFRRILYSDTSRNIERFLGVFECINEGPFNFNPDEVEMVNFFNRDEIQRMINNGEKFHPELLFILEALYGFVVSK